MNGGRTGRSYGRGRTFFLSPFYISSLSTFCTSKRDKGENEREREREGRRARKRVWVVSVVNSPSDPPADYPRVERIIRATALTSTITRERISANSLARLCVADSILINLSPINVIYARVTIAAPTSILRAGLVTAFPEFFADLRCENSLNAD